MSICVSQFSSRYSLIHFFLSFKLFYVPTQLDGCAQPAIVTKDLAMLVYGRDGRLGPRIKHLFQVHISALKYTVPKAIL